MQKVNDDISKINIALLDGEIYGTPIIEGKASEILAMATLVIEGALEHCPNSRRAFRKAARAVLRRTKPKNERKTDFILFALQMVIAFLAVTGCVVLLQGIIAWAVGRM